MLKGKRYVAIIVTISMLISMLAIYNTKIGAAETVYSGKSGDLEWSIDSDGLLTISGTGDYTTEESIYPAWNNYNVYVKSVIVNVSGIESTAHMFNGCQNLTSVDLSGLDTRNVTDMSFMFNGCANLVSVDLSGLNTSNVTYMRYMFQSCASLKSLEWSDLDTSSVTDMSCMFQGATSLTSLNLSNLDISNVTNMMSMFNFCIGLTSIDLGGLDARSVMNMSGMFAECHNLQSLNLSGFNAGNVISMSGAFMNCQNVENLDLSGFDMQNVMDMEVVIYGCNKLSVIKTPLNIPENIVCDLTIGVWMDNDGNTHSKLPNEMNTSITLKKYDKEDDFQQETTVTEETTTVEETITLAEEEKSNIVIDGFQINTYTQGMKTVYTYDFGAEVVEECGLIYGLGGYMETDEMLVDATNAYVKKFKSTDAGKVLNLHTDLPTTHSNSMTMRFVGHHLAEEFTQIYYVRAYAILEDGTVEYSDIHQYNAYEIADYLYSKQKMTTQEAFDYLYENILRIVDPMYIKQEFSSSTLV